MEDIILYTALTLLVTVLFPYRRILLFFRSIRDRKQVEELALKANKSTRKITIKSLHIYPVKSLSAVDLESVALDKYGFVGDRRLMIVRSVGGESQYRFLTQRQCPSLARLIAVYNEDQTTITIFYPSDDDEGSKQLTISLKKTHRAPRLEAGLWNDRVTVADVGGKEATEFLCHYLLKYDGQNPDCTEDITSITKSIKLVSVCEEFQRGADERYLTPSILRPSMKNLRAQIPEVTMNDGFPLLLASEASLNELNYRLKQKGKSSIGMNQFRPNIVISGDDLEPFEEDEWKVIQIGNLLFYPVKGCPRCKQSCTNQITSERSDEPLATLTEFRAFGKDQSDVYFAQNVVSHSSTGKISTGDFLKVLKTGPRVWDIGDVAAE